MKIQALKYCALAFIICCFVFCDSNETDVDQSPTDSIEDGNDINNPLGCHTDFDYNNEVGCDGQAYLDPRTSPYILPFISGDSYPLGLGNCASSFHTIGSPAEYAYDFNMPVGTEFIAIRSGTVIELQENLPSIGGGGVGGNWVNVDHGDGTYANYLHSPKNGIYVEVGDKVEQGDVLGITGVSGSAGYPHLHLAIIHGEYIWPYEGTPMTFSNVDPPDVILRTGVMYTACQN